MEGASREKDSDNEETEVRGNCFSFFPEMLRSRPPRGGLIPKGQLNDRMIRSMPENGRYCCVKAALHQERRPLPRCGADTLRVMTLQERLQEPNVSLSWASCQQVVKQRKVLRWPLAP